MRESEGGFGSHLFGVFGQFFPLLTTPRVEEHVQLGTEIAKTISGEALHHLLRSFPKGGGWQIVTYTLYNVYTIQAERKKGRKRKKERRKGEKKERRKGRKKDRQIDRQTDRQTERKKAYWNSNAAASI